MAEEDDRRPRLLGGDQAVQGPEVADDLVPAPFVGEMAEIGRGGVRPVAAMIAGVDCVACGVERGGETGIAGAVLGEAVGDLHDRARTPSWQPATREQGLAVVGAKRELAPRHFRPLYRLQSLCAGFLAKSGAVQRQGVKRAEVEFASWAPNFLLAELIAIG